MQLQYLCSLPGAPPVEADCTAHAACWFACLPGASGLQPTRRVSDALRGAVRAWHGATSAAYVILAYARGSAKQSVLPCCCQNHGPYFKMSEHEGKMLVQQVTSCRIAYRCNI
jgi:hypothetical protein